MYQPSCRTSRFHVIAASIGVGWASLWAASAGAEPIMYNLSDLYDRPIYTQADEADRIGSPSDAAIGSGMHAGASDGSSSSDDGDRTLGSEDGSSPRNTRPTPQH